MIKNCNLKELVDLRRDTIELLNDIMRRQDEITRIFDKFFCSFIATENSFRQIVANDKDGFFEDLYFRLYEDFRGIQLYLSDIKIALRVYAGKKDEKT